MPGPARARTCGHAVVLTLPGVTWGDLARFQPPHLLAALRQGAAGSASVRTITPQTSFGDGFATIGAGARVQGGVGAGGIAFGSSRPEPASFGLGAPFRAVNAAGVPEMRALAERAGYNAEPGALGTALQRHGIMLAAVGNGDPGNPPLLPVGYGKWTLLAGMDVSGLVHSAAVGDNLLRAGAGAFGVRTDLAKEMTAVAGALARPCSVVVVDGGDLVRADLAALASGKRDQSRFRSALFATDALLGRIQARLRPQRDLLLIVSPTSSSAAGAQHLGVAIAVGPAFPAGASLESVSTRRAGFVTLPDVAPTVLSFLHLGEPAVMNGGPWFAVASRGQDRLGSLVATDQEATLIDRLQPPVTTVFVVFQVLVYIVALLLVLRREHSVAPTPDRFRSVLELVVLSVVAFPVATYLGGLFPARSLGAWGTSALLVAIDVVLVALVTLLFEKPLDRLLAVTAATCALLLGDLALGAPLQLSTVFGYSPIVAGRFAGIGNIGFAVLASSSVLTGALVVHRQRGSRASLLFAGGLFVITILADGLPALGSDVGGVLALVPSLIVTWVLLAGKRPTLRLVLLALAAVAGAVALFLAFDLSRPAVSQTHLARLFEEVRARGGSVLSDTIARKARANFEVFRSTVWTLWVPPAFAVLAWLLVRPKGRWQMLAETYPYLRAGLVGALLVGVLGFATNDSGIVIPATVLPFLLPLAVLLHLSLMGRERA